MGKLIVTEFVTAEEVLSHLSVTTRRRWTRTKIRLFFPRQSMGSLTPGEAQLRAATVRALLDAVGRLDSVMFMPSTDGHMVIRLAGHSDALLLAAVRGALETLPMRPTHADVTGGAAPYRVFFQPAAD